MTNLPLSSTFEYSADWYLPEHPDVRVSGRLTYTSERAEIQLNDAFTPMRGDLLSAPIPDYPVIHGISTKGEALTVLRAQRLGINFNFGPAGLRQPERLISSWLIVGAHVSAEQKYYRVNFFIPGLEIWLSSANIGQSIEQDSNSERITHTFVVRQTDSEITAAPAIDATLEWRTGTTLRTVLSKSVSIDVLGSVSISPATPKPIDWFFEQQGKLSTMMAFLAGRPMPIDAISAHISETTQPISLLVAMRQADKYEFKSINDFLVPRSKLGDSFPSVVANWFREVESVLVPSQLALGILSTKDLWLHIEFLSLIQALEGFHRGRYGGNYMDDSDYESVKATLGSAIPATISNDHRDALRSRIRYGNQISLSKRLNELCGCLGDDLAQVVFATSGKIPRRWIDTRNYHTHWDEELRQDTIDGQEMYNANARMEHFLRLLYLLLMGVTKETLLECYENSNGASLQLIQLNIIARQRPDPTQAAGVIMGI
ncbi:MAG: hypothetical protein IV094_25665 [Vitreoscilla sp.]|nr:hypothetical protein [Vitreoscilla sp.]